MTSFSDTVLQTMVRRYRPNGRLAITPIATGKFNSSYWVQVGDELLVLRISPPNDAVYVFYEAQMMRQEPALHALLRAETTVPVPEIVAFDCSQTVVERDYMLLRRLPGRPLSEMPHVNHAYVLRQVGECLAQVHRLTAVNHGYLGDHRPMEPQASWAVAFVIMWHKLIDDVVAEGFYNAAESHYLRHLLDRHLPLFDRPVTSRLLHMDVWAQNILVDDNGTLTGLLDWDRALWGDPEIEFAVLDYCGISEPSFWQGYGQLRDWSPAAQIRQRFYLLYELQKYIVIRNGRLHDPIAAQRYKEQALALALQIPT
ncbi:MAG: aminoglycoside phosphotransferase family protein [Chloroflexota bacterium]